MIDGYVISIYDMHVCVWISYQFIYWAGGQTDYRVVCVGDGWLVGVRGGISARWSGLFA